MNDVILAGDIGGTKTSLALFDRQTGPMVPLDKKIFPSKEFGSLEEIIQEFLAGKAVQIRAASFGVSGPVKGGVAQTTNLPWTLTEASLSALLEGGPVYLLNDLSAAAHGVPYLDEKDLFSLNAGAKDGEGAIGLVSPGTGLGEAFLTWDGMAYKAHPSEGGHASFGPTSRRQLALLEFMQSRYDYISYERVCSGNGIPNIYDYFREVERIPEPLRLQSAIAEVKDPNPVIFKAALEAVEEIAVRTLELFVEILASEAANLALKVAATGGIYLGGGIPPRLIDWLEPEVFMRNFSNRGRFSDWPSEIPVQIITRPEIALFGAACHGFEQENFFIGDINANTQY